MGVFVGEDDETKTDILQAAKRIRWAGELAPICWAARAGLKRPRVQPSKGLLFQGLRGARVREDSFRPKEAAELDMVQEPREEMECLAMVGMVGWYAPGFVQDERR